MNLFIIYFFYSSWCVKLWKIIRVKEYKCSIIFGHHHQKWTREDEEALPEKKAQRGKKIKIKAKNESLFFSLLAFLSFLANMLPVNTRLSGVWLAEREAVVVGKRWYCNITTVILLLPYTLVHAFELTSFCSLVGFLFPGKLQAAATTTTTSWYTQ